MSDSSPSFEPSSGGLQFDKADFGRGGPGQGVHRCADCEQLLATSYYTVDGRVTCFDCSDKASVTPKQDLRGLPMAIVFGAGAAALGALVYLLILKFTGWEVGLISIAVGWLVGKGMMKGSKNRGGRAYQVLAVLLTYHSIVFSYLAVGVWQYLEASSNPQTVAEGQATPGQEAGAPAPPAEAQPGAVANGGAQPVPAADEPQFSSFPAFLVWLYFYTLAVPFMQGFENIIGLAIIAFGLWEAWRLTRLQVPAIAGPFQFGEGPQIPSAATPAV